jgi:hypothetical protein
MNRLAVHRVAILFVLLFAVFVGAAPTLRHVAVFETMTDADSVMNEAELRYLTNELRKQAANELPTAQYSVMTRDNILSLIPPDKNAAECFEGMCLVEIGRNVGADYAVQGTVSRFGSYLTLTVEAYETMSGKLVKSITANSKTVDGFLEVLKQDVAPLYEAILVNDGNAEALAKAKKEQENEKAALEAPPEAPKRIDPQVPSVPAEGSGGGLAWNHWVGIGLDALGVAGLVFGIVQNSAASDAYSDYEKASTQDQANSTWKKFEDAKSLRNVGYIAGGVLLAGGLTFHFAF